MSKYDALPPETQKLLSQGKLQQTCRTCGRWEWAHWYCSWCYRPMTPDDWYRSASGRRDRLPAAAPTNPPPELRDKRSWPEQWGENPHLLTRTDAEDPGKSDVSAPVMELCGSGSPEQIAAGL